MGNSSKGGDAPIARRAYSIREWCAANGIAVSTFYAAPAADKPAIIRLGKRCLITNEAHEAWRVRMEGRPA
jgi:hypothetical protein